MKIIPFLGAFLLTVGANAQNVIKTSDGFATVNQPSNSYEVGDHVQFLDAKLNSVGKGSITKLSEGQGLVLIKIEEGKVRVGQTIERVRISSEAMKSAPVKKSELKNEQNQIMDLSSLTAEEKEIYDRGELSTTRYVIGGIVGSYPGFGIGHAVQGRYREKGWIFTVGEVGALAVALTGVSNCLSNNWFDNNSCSSGNSALIGIGVWTYIGFHIWEIIDVWATPPEQNRRYRQLRSRLGQSKGAISMFPVFRPVDRGAVLGLGATF